MFPCLRETLLRRLTPALAAVPRGLMAATLAAPLRQLRWLRSDRWALVPRRAPLERSPRMAQRGPLGRCRRLLSGGRRGVRAKAPRPGLATRPAGPPLPCRRRRRGHRPALRALRRVRRIPPRAALPRLPGGRLWARGGTGRRQIWTAPARSTALPSGGLSWGSGAAPPSCSTSALATAGLGRPPGRPPLQPSTRGGLGARRRRAIGRRRPRYHATTPATTREVRRDGAVRVLPA